MGGGSGTGSSSSTATDSNGVPLPASTAPTGSTSQEVPTSGSAQVTGSIEVDSGGANVNTDNDPSNDIDLSTIQVQLVAPDGTVVATTNMNALGEYIFNVPDLSNDTYRVLINSGLGVNYAYQDFNFTFNPTAGPSTPVSIPTMQAERLFYTSGAAEISGVVNTPGYNNLVSVPAGGLAGVTVQLVDKDGNVAATRTTDSSGNYSFSLVNLPNGNYFIVVLGSSISQNSRSFVDQTIPVRFTFEGNNPVVATVLSVSDASLAWDAASSSAGQISGTVSNAAIPSGDTSVSFTVTLKDASGDIIASTSPDSSGNYSFNQSLSNGVYYVEVTRTNFLTATVSFLFASHPSGGSNVKNISVAAINVVPRPSNISGTVTDGVITPVPGAVINFRPDKTMTPVQLAYMLAGSDDRLRNLAGMWIREVCPAWNGTAPGIAQCIGTTAGKCNGTSAAYCNYQTYQNKVYEVSGSNVVFAAAAGIWQYYISAPGYSSSSTSSITLNGSDITASSILMSPSTHRTQIAGSAIVLDNLVNGTKKAYQGAIPGYTNASTSLPGLFVVILGNNDTAGNPVAHITITNGTGAFVFDGNSKVISLPSLLANDTQRVGYAIQNFASAATLSSAGSVSGSSTGDSVQIVAGNFQFKQGSYAVVIVDPLGHLSASSTRADNNPGATSLYAVNSVNAMVLHLPRRKVSGNVSNAITTDSLNGAAVALGRDSNPDPNVVDFNANVTKDYDTISGASRFAAGSDQLVAAVATDAAGNYSIDNIDPGEYVLKITKAGYGDSYIPVSVSSIANNVVNSQLIENAGTGNLSGFVKLPGGFSFTGTYSLELVNPTSGMRPTSGIQPSSLSSGATTFSNVPKYDVFQINAGQWKLRFVAPGYKSVEGIVNIQKDTSTNFDIITMVPGSNGPATVSGRALNALNNSGIPNLSVRLRPGINVTSGAYATDINGAVIAAVSTASDGSFAIPGVTPGNYSLEVAGTNFSTTYRTVISAGTDTPSNQNILVSPILVNNEMRIVLSWNAIPRDLDSHLEFGNSSCVSGGKKCQVVWNDKNKLGGDLKLDYDITTGHGPETVTITGSAWTQPRLGYSIYNWSNEAAMSTSGAVIRVFGGKFSA
ncbi:MAG: Cna protein B-type domain protein [Leptospira sp.]|nr:Cna protein B-type domain protein [Leptospira sp.]